MLVTGLLWIKRYLNKQNKQKRWYDFLKRQKEFLVMYLFVEDVKQKEKQIMLKFSRERLHVKNVEVKPCDL